MRIVQPKDLKDLKSYAAYLDPFDQRVTQPDLTTLRRRLYADVIMNDHVITSVAHILQSNATTQLFLEEPELLDEEIVVPFIGHPFSSMDERIDGFLEATEKEKEFYAELGVFTNNDDYYMRCLSRYPSGCSIDLLRPQDLIEKKKELLLEHTKVATTISPSKSQEVLRETIQKDFDIQVSPFKDDFKDLKEIYEFINSILYSGSAKKYYLNRDVISILLNRKEISEKQKNFVFKVLNANYYIAGISELDCTLSTSQPFVNIYKKKFEGGIFSKTKRIFDTEIIFDTYLDAMAIQKAVLDKLDIGNLLAIRKDKATKNYREKINEIVIKISGGKPFDDTLSDIKDLGLEIEEAIRSEASKQTHWSDRISKLESGSTISLSVLALLNFYTIYSLLLGGAAILDPLLCSWIKENKCNFVVVADKITNRARRKN